MKIARDAVVGLDYTLKNDAGEVLDESKGEPLTYMHGHGQLVPGLEKALEGQSEGTKLQVVVAPKDGYGERGQNRVLEVPMDQFPADGDPEVGMALEAVGPDGQTAVLWIVAKTEDSVSLSLDHPLAGETLHFDVTVQTVRKATKEELSHGHVHGPGGHHHH